MRASVLRCCVGAEMSYRQRQSDAPERAYVLAVGGGWYVDGGGARCSGRSDGGVLLLVQLPPLPRRLALPLTEAEVETLVENVEATAAGELAWLAPVPGWVYVVATPAQVLPPLEDA